MNPLFKGEPGRYDGIPPEEVQAISDYAEDILGQSLKINMLGMYAVSNPAYPRVKIGKYTICRQDDKSVWIQTDDGEGRQFSDESFLAVIDEYYNKMF